MSQLLGAEEAQSLCACLEQPAPTSIRLNRHKYIPAKIVPSDLEQVPWCSWGYYIPERPTFTGDAAFHGGVYYVQEASSMLLYQIGQLLDSSAPLVALDLCAAPGGKSTLLLDLLPEGSLLVANEVVPQRAHILVENLQKWGNPMHITTSTLPERLGKIRGAFDLILVDAPCSGEGMFRKDLGARNQWQPSSPKVCAERQRTILADIWPALEDGGLLVYSTCTMNRQENEDIVAYLVDELEAEPIDLGEIGHGVWRSTLSDYPCYRMLPHRAKGEGLFMAILRKGGECAIRGDRSKSKKGKDKQGRTSKDVPQEAKGWVDGTKTKLLWEADQGRIVAYPEALAPMLELLRGVKVSPMSYGIPVAEVKGKSVLPLAPLALSTLLADDAFERVELLDDQLIPYLSREAITLPSSLSTGIKLICYGGIPLGFAKHLGSRTNNLYPTHWRIRHREQVERLQAEQEEYW